MKTFILLIIGIMTSCMAPKYISTIVTDTYDEKKDQTTYMVFPFGSLSLPGKWTKTAYNKISGQQNFKNKDSLGTALLINRNSGYSFYTKEMSPNKFVKAMYQWDSDYFSSQFKGNCKILKQDTINHYIIWQITADNEKNKFDNVYLFGSENGIVFTVRAPIENVTLSQKIEFVQTVYENKTVGTCCK